MTNIVHIKSIAKSCVLNGLPSPVHPLIMVVRQWPVSKYNLSQVKFTSDLYYIALKRKISGSFLYGRNTYDYQEGTMVFISPGQVATFSQPKDNQEDESGWSLLFHPDLIRRSELGNEISNYSFFNYETTEALHLSDKERNSINSIVDNIENEINQNLDKHSQDIIIHNLHTLLKYSSRFYDRQFYTRTNLSKGIVADFELFLKSYFSSNQLAEKGIPTVQECGEMFNYSGSYLSDMLKVETGMSIREHIYKHLLEKAKTMLLNSQLSVSELAYSLGFGYPQSFSKFFKSKTGMTPSAFRNLN